MAETRMREYSGFVPTGYGDLPMDVAHLIFADVMSDSIIAAKAMRISCKAFFDVFVLQRGMDHLTEYMNPGQLVAEYQLEVVKAIEEHEKSLEGKQISRDGTLTPWEPDQRMHRVAAGVVQIRPGAGKTIILARYLAERLTTHGEKAAHKRTLIVVPPAIVLQWADEINLFVGRHLSKHGVLVHTFHMDGTIRNVDARATEALAAASIVIVSNKILEHRMTPLLKLRWYRVIWDEKSSVNSLLHRTMTQCQDQGGVAWTCGAYSSSFEHFSWRLLCPGWRMDDFDMWRDPAWKRLSVFKQLGTIALSTFSLPTVEFEELEPTLDDFSDRWSTVGIRRRFLEANWDICCDDVLDHSNRCRSGNRDDYNLRQWKLDGDRPCVGLLKYIADLIDARVELGGGVLFFFPSNQIRDQRVLPGFHDLMSDRGFSIHYLPGGAQPLRGALAAAKKAMVATPKHRRLFVVAESAYSVGVNLQHVANHVVTMSYSDTTRQQQLGRVLRPGQTKPVSAVFIEVDKAAKCHLSYLWTREAIDTYAAEVRDYIRLSTDAEEILILQRDPVNSANWIVERMPGNTRGVIAGCWQLTLVRYLNHCLATNAQPSDLGTVRRERGVRHLHLNVNTLRAFIYYAIRNRYDLLYKTDTTEWTQ